MTPQNAFAWGLRIDTWNGKWSERTSETNTNNQLHATFNLITSAYFYMRKFIKITIKARSYKMLKFCKFEYKIMVNTVKIMRM